MLDSIIKIVKEKSFFKKHFVAYDTLKEIERLIKQPDGAENNYIAGEHLLSLGEVALAVKCFVYTLMLGGEDNPVCQQARFRLATLDTNEITNLGSQIEAELLSRPYLKGLTAAMHHLFNDVLNKQNNLNTCLTCIELINRNLSEQDLLTFRLVNKGFNQEISKSFEKQSPFNEKMAFTLATSGFFSGCNDAKKDKENHDDGWRIYSNTIEHYISVEPAMFYRLDDMEKFLCDGTYTAFAANEDPHFNGRIYSPDITPSQSHHWSTNAIWLLSLIHKKIPVTLYSEVTGVNAYRHTNQGLVSAFAREISAVWHAGYRLQLDFEKGRLKLIPNRKSLSVSSRNLVESESTVIGAYNEIRKNATQMREVLSPLKMMIENFIQSKGVRPQIAFNLLNEKERSVAVSDKIICTAYIMLTILKEATHDQIPAALNVILNIINTKAKMMNKNSSNNFLSFWQNVAEKAKNKLGIIDHNQFFKSLLTKIKSIESEHFTCISNAYFTPEDSEKILELEEKLLLVQYNYESLNDDESSYDPRTLEFRQRIKDYYHKNNFESPGLP